MFARFFMIMIIALSLTACGSEARVGTPIVIAPVPLPPDPSSILKTFGYAAIICDLDDPFDDTDKTDYSDEVRDFTNANLVCLGPDIEDWPMRLRAARAQFTPVLMVEPAFFNIYSGGGGLVENYEMIWREVRKAIHAADIQDGDIIFYLADEPALRGIAPDLLSTAAKTLKRDFPISKILLVEAYDPKGLPVIPAEIDIWAFNAYTVRDPAAEPLYTNYLNLAKTRLGSGQELALIMDGIHTPFHAEAGLSESDMAEVAENYFQLALTRGDISAIFVYTWAGGIDGADEKGVRNLPKIVQSTHRRIGRAITGK